MTPSHSAVHRLALLSISVAVVLVANVRAFCLGAGSTCLAECRTDLQVTFLGYLTPPESKPVTLYELTAAAGSIKQWTATVQRGAKGGVGKASCKCHRRQTPSCAAWHSTATLTAVPYHRSLPSATLQTTQALRSHCTMVSGSSSAVNADPNHNSLRSVADYMSVSVKLTPLSGHGCYHTV